MFIKHMLLNVSNSLKRHHYRAVLCQLRPVAWLTVHNSCMGEQSIW